MILTNGTSETMFVSNAGILYSTAHGKELRGSEIHTFLLQIYRIIIETPNVVCCRPLELS